MLNIPMPFMPKVPCRPGVPPPRVPEALQWPMSLLLEKFTKYRKELVEEVAGVVGKGQVKSVNGRIGDVALAASDVGLGNVANTGDSAVPVAGGTTKFTTGGAYAELAKKVSVADLFDNPATAPTIKSSLLPSYVDDVLEYASPAAFPATGETGKIYVAKDTNKTYRWPENGSAYVEIAKSVNIVPPSTDPADAGKAADAKATGDALAAPALLAQYYPDGSVKNAEELTSGIKYDFDAQARTATTKPFCNTGDADSDNSGLVGRVVIPPFVDGHGNPYLTDDGTRYRVVGMGESLTFRDNQNLTAIVAPSTVTIIGIGVFYNCTALASASLPAATSVGASAFGGCTVLASVSLPDATTVEEYAFSDCTALASVDFGAVPRPGLSVPTLGIDAFLGVPTSCKVIVPDAQYAGWTAQTIPDPEHEGETITNPWYALVTAGYKFLRHSEWEHARRYELPTKTSDLTNDSGYITQHQQLTPIYSQTPTFSEWVCTPSEADGVAVLIVEEEGGTWRPSREDGAGGGELKGDALSTAITWSIDEWWGGYRGGGDLTATRTRTDIVGYTLGDQTAKPLQPQGDYALLAQLYEAVRNLAPDFTAKTYAVNDLCTYSGVFYRCKSTYTATAQDAKPDTDTTHWEAKKASELFLPLTGGAVTGSIEFPTAPIYAIDFGEGLCLGYSNPDELLFTNKRRNVVILVDMSKPGILAHVSDIGIPVFSPTATYALNAKVVYDNAVWNCTTAVSTPGAWTGTANWTKLFDLDTGAPASGGTKLITNGQVHTALQGKADAAALAGKLDSSSAAPAFSESATYAVGEYVTYNGVLYECVVAKSTASDTAPDNDIYDASTATTNHWEVTDISEIIGNVEAALYVINNGSAI